LILPDVNVLIYAFRSDADQHADYKAWLESVINGSAAYGIAPQVLSSVVRICTHPRIFKRPSRISEVFEFCRVLLEQPNASAVTPGERHEESSELPLVSALEAFRNVPHDRHGSAPRLVLH